MNMSEKNIGCVQAATDIIGDKWTPLLLRYIANEETVRFCRLQDLAGGINPRTLSARLSHLEQHGVIKKNATGSQTRHEYQLTKKGEDLLPIIHDMSAWSERYAEAHHA